MAKKGKKITIGDLKVGDKIFTINFIGNCLSVLEVTKVDDRVHTTDVLYGYNVTFDINDIYDYNKLQQIRGDFTRRLVFMSCNESLIVNFYKKNF